MLEHDPLITEYSHERARPRADEALKTLQHVASVVKPLMRQRGWRVGVLAEFYPEDRTLLGLNWNRGQKICLRLRYPGDERQFMPFENVVDTMLHELAHIVHGPHDAPFHALWNQLRDEHEALLRKGYTGEGFLSKGHKLGGRSARIPKHEARRRAQAAAAEAEKRRAQGAGSGQKLGGKAVSRGQDIRRVIADAAQRRIDVTRGCGSAGAEGGAAGRENDERRRKAVDEQARNGFRTRAEEDDANERAIMEAYIELIQEEERQQFGAGYVPPSQENPVGSYGLRKASATATAAADVAKAELANLRAPAVPVHSKPTPNLSTEKGATASTSGAAQSTAPRAPSAAAKDRPAPSPSPPPSASPQPASDTWTCEICTLHNPPSYLVCDACGTERPFSTLSAADIAFDGAARVPLHQRASQSRPTPKTTASDSANFTPSHVVERELKRSRSAKTLQKLGELHEAERKKPLGWLCARCGTFMESEWWTCASCGTVKASS